MPSSHPPGQIKAPGLEALTRYAASNRPAGGRKARRYSMEWDAIKVWFRGSS